MRVDAATGASVNSRGNWLATGLTALVAAALAGLPELVRPGYYFQDDMQSQYVPLFLELGKSWARGELPLVTDRTWAGGAISGEYQHGVFSFVHAGLTLALQGLRLDPPRVALWLTAVYAALTAGGAFQLALHYRVGRALALGVALVASLNGFSVYFSSWLPALTGWVAPTGRSWSRRCRLVVEACSASTTSRLASAGRARSRSRWAARPWRGSR